MFKYLFKRDTLFTTIAVFLVMGLLALIPLNTHVLDPLKMALSDFDYNDLAFSESRTDEPSHIDSQIVVVNIDTASRATLAKYLNRIQVLKPKVVGLDVTFDGPREPEADSALAKAMRDCPSLVSAYTLDEHDSYDFQENFFGNVRTAESGYVNFVGEDTGVIRNFEPFVKRDRGMPLAFAAAVSKIADAKAFERLLKRNHTTEIINYARRNDEVTMFEADVLFDSSQAGLFAGKIVLLGYVTRDPNNFLDRHFTPMNSRVVGKSWPDMSGVIVHANILRMILGNDYINRVPSWVNWLIAVVLCWLMSAVFIRFYLDKHLWFHLAAKTAQLIFAILFVYLGLLFFSRMDLKMNLTPALVAVILVVDVLYFYEALSVWLHRKWGYKTIFYREHH